jgi:hypothetical protein
MQNTDLSENSKDERQKKQEIYTDPGLIDPH